MKHDATEIAAVEKVVEEELVQVTELQLALVGGGTGEVVWS